MNLIPLIARIVEAKALADEVRILILELLSQKPMSVYEIAEELKKRGLYKDINTIRYHIRLLKDAGLISLVGVKEVKGGVLKYYASRRKVYPVEAPPDIEEKIKPISNYLYNDLKKLVLKTVMENRDVIVEAAKSLKPCPYCITRHFAEYIILEAFRYTLGKLMNDPEVKEVLEGLEPYRRGYKL